MKRITMTLIGLVFAFSANAQKLSMESPQPAKAPEFKKAVLFDQSNSPDELNGIVSIVNNTGAGVYSADDFELTSENRITSITAFGFNINGDFTTNVTGINVYVYANNPATNTPEGGPDQVDTGLLELINIDPTGSAIEIIQDGVSLDIKIDVAEALGSAFILPAGNYWLVVAPTQDIPDFDASARWHWYGAGVPEAGVNGAHLIDPSDAFGRDYTTWTPFTAIPLLRVGSAAFIIEGESNEPFPAPYCGPLVYDKVVEPITSVEFAGISNRTDGIFGATPAHEDFTSVNGDVLAGESYEIALQGNTSGNNISRFAVFIDWNQNDFLDDAGEVYEITQTITDSDGNDGIQAVQTLVVPANALAGKTRMRVKKIFGLESFSNPCLGSNYGQTEDYSINVTLPLARLQVVHNSPDPALEVVDVYLNGDLLLDNFAFRTATSFIDAPANTPITIDIAPGTSVDVSESVFNVSPTLVDAETYIAVASGTLDSSISLEVFAGAREAAAVAGNTDVLVHHGSPDAPTVDVVNQDGGGILVDDISYPEFQGYLELPTDNYLLDITTADNSTKVAGYQAYLAELGLADAAVTVFASGFLNPAENQDGPAFGLWVSLATGGALIELKDEDFVEFPAPYCGPLEFSTNVEPITNVEFAGFTNRSDAAVDGSPAHEDFTSVVGQVSAGESYDIILEANTNGNFDSRFAVFIDWNQNDVFDTDEVYEITTIITFSTGEDDQQAIQSIEVPVGAVVGQTRMRVKKIYGDVEYLDPCIGSFYGQTEDYTVNVAGTLSNSTYDSADFTYYPNPVKGILSISIASKVDNLKVYNMLGQLVVETAPKVSNPQLDMNGLQPGLYLVTLEVEGSLQTFSVVKQ